MADLSICFREDYRHLAQQLDPTDHSSLIASLNSLVADIERTSEEDTSKWVIDFSDLELQKQIGSGGFAEVFLGYHKLNGTVVAVKRLHQEELEDSVMFNREVETLANLQHFAVLPFVGVCRNPLCIVTQFMSGGSLYSRLHAQESVASIVNYCIRNCIWNGIYSWERDFAS
jgi:serine/threonine protein kinase